jgi:hypothetical protein
VEGGEGVAEGLKSERLARRDNKANKSRLSNKGWERWCTPSVSVEDRIEMGREEARALQKYPVEALKDYLGA